MENDTQSHLCVEKKPERDWPPDASAALDRLLVGFHTSGVIRTSPAHTGPRYLYHRAGRPGLETGKTIDIQKRIFKSVIRLTPLKVLCKFAGYVDATGCGPGPRSDEVPSLPLACIGVNECLYFSSPDVALPSVCDASDWAMSASRLHMRISKQDRF